ncbi:hypothetical protein H257_04101 [Aphanomyces astaci]|uniref:Uncharacterized protein n=1 Tax=Aphanomyces astaci TaxID=112090 RepID=W4GUD6_APHAT|nr:hypothetical protein H257_04101 [Aphanomyces astaci]ETV83350.1 hypothetical protein H257_04101 [Aphanomyces astaci]|eukprot:XP_009826780.1 hypothetical protein H257_04101 [Aphanomyces astaci]
MRPTWPAHTPMRQLTRRLRRCQQAIDVLAADISRHGPLKRAHLELHRRKPAQRVQHMQLFVDKVAGFVTWRRCANAASSLDVVRTWMVYTIERKSAESDAGAETAAWKRTEASAATAEVAGQVLIRRTRVPRQVALHGHVQPPPIFAVTATLSWGIYFRTREFKEPGLLDACSAHYKMSAFVVHVGHTDLVGKLPRDAII